MSFVEKLLLGVLKRYEGNKLCLWRSSCRPPLHTHTVLNNFTTLPKCKEVATSQHSHFFFILKCKEEVALCKWENIMLLCYADLARRYHCGGFFVGPGWILSCAFSSGKFYVLFFARIRMSKVLRRTNFPSFR